MNYQRHERRGLVILIVLSMLVLFLMMGATLLVLSTRSRAASRAFLAASDQPEAAVPILPRSILDEALLLLIRGSQDPSVSGPSGLLRESLLADMYGNTSNVTSTNNATVEWNRVPFRDGRVRAGYGNGTLAPYGEPFDAFDTGNATTDFNPFLTKMIVLDDGSGGSTVRVERAAFQPAGNTSMSFQVDNDEDGIPDGWWLSTTANGTRLFGNATSSSGSSLSFAVSYLVLDLDGRVNVNAHGGNTGPSTALGPAFVDLSTGNITQAIGSGTLDRIRSGATSVRGNGTNQTPPIDPAKLRQAPLLAGSIPGRGVEPYDLRLDFDAFRPGDITLSSSAANPFTLGDLERLLRPFDSDWAGLPPRLASMVPDLDVNGRMTFTTDSWDVPFMTGLAAPPPPPPPLPPPPPPTPRPPREPQPGPRPKFDLTGNQWGRPPFDKNSAAGREQYAQELFATIQSVFAPSPPPAGSEQWCANVAEYWAFSVTGNATSGNMTVGLLPGLIGVKPTDIPTNTAGAAGPESDKWTGTQAELLSVADLLSVPEGSKSDIESKFPASPDERVPATSPIVSLAAKSGNERILEAVGLASPFAATTGNDRFLMLPVGGTPVRFAVREPGRVNVNTCSPDVWTAVCGDGRPRESIAMETTWDILKHAWPVGDSSKDVTTIVRTRGNRLATIATVRSNVFAVWITLEVTDYGLDAGSPTLHRLFAIVDRSIPVNYAPGTNTVEGSDGAGMPATTDVRNIIRLKRFLN